VGRQTIEMWSPTDTLNVYNISGKGLVIRKVVAFHVTSRSSRTSVNLFGTV
jgi:hypothetical protein